MSTARFDPNPADALKNGTDRRSYTIIVSPSPCLSKTELRTQGSVCITDVEAFASSSSTETKKPSRGEATVSPRGSHKARHRVTSPERGTVCLVWRRPSLGCLPHFVHPSAHSSPCVESKRGHSSTTTAVYRFARPMPTKLAIVWCWDYLLGPRLV